MSPTVSTSLLTEDKCDLTAQEDFSADGAKELEILRYERNVRYE